MNPGVAIMTSPVLYGLPVRIFQLLLTHGHFTTSCFWLNTGFEVEHDVNAFIVLAAHTTQFAQPGDSYFKHGSGVGYLDNGGSYVTFKSSDNKHMTIVIETMVTVCPQRPSLQIVCYIAWRRCMMDGECTCICSCTCTLYYLGSNCRAIRSIRNALMLDSHRKMWQIRLLHLW